MTAPSPAPRIHVIGWSDSGKTMLVERVVERLVQAGLRVATVKHAHHGFELDRPGTDSTRHLVAGAGAVVLVGPDGWALQQRDHTPLDTICSRLAEDGFDLVICEGGAQPGGAAAIVLPGGRTPAPEPEPGPRLVLDHHPGALDDATLDTVVAFCRAQSRKQP